MLWITVGRSGDKWSPLWITGPPSSDANRPRAAPKDSDPDARTFRRMVFAEAVDLELDAQGRILLPPELRQYAEIDRDAYVVGVNTSIEIWSPARWDAQSALMENDGAEIAQRLATLL